MRAIDEIIIHCSATPEGRNYTAVDIDRWHRQRGFNGIGYHYVILLDGSIEQGRLLGQVGAHCVGHNAHSIGICYIGGLAADGKTPKDTRTPQQHESMTMLLRNLHRHWPAATIHGHCEFAAKACPSFDVQAWIKEIEL